MKDEDTIKYKENPKGRGSENYERNTVVIRTVLVINFKKYIQELILCQRRFYLDKANLFLLYCHLNPLYLLPNSIESSFLTHFLQIHCIEFFGSRDFQLLGLGFRLSPYNYFDLNAKFCWGRRSNEDIVCL